MPDVDAFRRQMRDLYIGAGDIGFWQAALRERSDELYEPLQRRIAERQAFVVDVLNSDFEGGQRVVTSAGITPHGEDAWLPSIGRQWNLDRPDPR